MKAAFLAAVLAGASGLAQVPPSAFVNFEGAQTNPIRLSPDGTRLFAVNTPDARLSVFDLTSPSAPKRIAEIPVGIEPVSVNARSNDEVWVVNQESDSISIVSVSRGIVVDTISVKDEPADVVFAGADLAFVSAARNNQVAVIDATTHVRTRTIPLVGHNPRALAVSPDGTKVYVAFALSGNHTTMVPIAQAPPQPAPTNPALPPPPPAGLIIDAGDPNWTNVIRYTVPDNDIAVIDVNTLGVSGYYTGIGTNNLGLAVRPNTGELFVANTEALNLTFYEPNLKGHFVNNRVTRVSATGQKTFLDLNPGIVYSAMPNAADLTIALAQPTAVAFNTSGRYLYVAAFGTDRVAVIDLNTNAIGRVEIGPARGSTVNPATKRGPRGLAVNGAAQRMYVLNRISNSISIVDTGTFAVLSEIPVGAFDPTPTVIRNGRGFLYDAKLSGTGTASCASCHVDAELDFLAWNLGDPGGQMATVTQNGATFSFHPMKGPMTTQTLRGLNQLSPFHWRGDKVNFQAFNPAFNTLLGGDQLSTTDMNAYTAFINTVVFQPNPYQNLDRTYPTSVMLPNGLGTGNASAGLNLFMTYSLDATKNGQCNTCHQANPGPGTNRGIQPGKSAMQPIKTPQLRNQYQKLDFNNAPGAVSILGFGNSHGGEETLYQVVSNPVFPNLVNNTTAKNHITAYLMAFDTGTAPAVGYTRTARPSTVSSPSLMSDWNLLQAQAAAGNIDLIAKGTIRGAPHGLLYLPASNNYTSDQTGLGPFTQAQLVTLIQSGDIVSIMGVPPGSGVRMGIDRNLDGTLDGNQ